MEKIILIANISILPGFEEEIKKAIITLATETRKEAGCELFLVNTRNDSPQKIVFYEIYLDQEAFDQHGTYVHTQQFFEIVKGKIENAKPEVIFLTTLAS